MKIRNKITALLLCTVITLLSLCSCGLMELVPDFMLPDKSDSYHEIQQMVTVSIEDGAYYKVTSQNPIRVKKGGTVSFNIEIGEGYEFDSTSLGEYKDGVLTVSDVRFPTTVSVVLKKESTLIGGDTGDGGNTDDDGGDDSDNTGGNTGGGGVDGETPVVPADPIKTDWVKLDEPVAEDGYHFICWTLDKPAEEGGELLTENKTGRFEIAVDRVPVANFVDNEHYVLLYRTNGGTTSDGKNYYYQTFSNKNFYMPNTVHQNGTFVRDGYALMRYTTEKNGGGDYTTLGGKIEVNENGFIELWLKWGQETTSGFQYEIYTDENGEQAASVKSYTGAAINVVIPDSIRDSATGNTYPVKKISANAFDGTKMYTLLIPSTMHTIEDGAFVNCKNLHTLTVHDNLWEVSDAIFQGCDNLATYYLNSARDPVFAGSTEGLFCMKYEKIREAHTRGKKKIMVMSGSSSLYGFSAEQMENAFYGEYWVINYGTNAGALGTLYLDAFIRFFDEGDIVIHAPEMNNAAYLGGGEITYLTYRGTEEMYEVFSFVDMRKYKGFFDGLKVFNQEKRNSSKGVSYEKYGGSINKMTDLTTNKDEPNFAPSGTSNPYNAKSVNATIIANINAINARYNERGTTMYYSFAPIDMAILHENSLKKENQDAYVARLREVLDYEVISHPSDYYYEHKYFYNSTYHPGITGRTMRTTALIADLKAQLIKEGRWEEPVTNE